MNTGTRPVQNEEETVCAALARYEATLRDAVRELHVDVSAFKLGVERRLEEAGLLTGPLGHVVTQLQQENRQLRAQLEALTRQVEALTGVACERSGFQTDLTQTSLLGPSTIGTASHSPQTPPGPAASSDSCPTANRFSSRARFSLSGKISSPEKEEPIEVDLAPVPSVVQNGHTSTAENSMAPQEVRSTLSDVLQEQTAPVSMVMPHLPITATTKTAESSVAPVTKILESLTGPIQTLNPAVSGTSPGQSTASSSQSQAISEASLQSAPAVKTWSPSPVRTLGSPRVTEKHTSMPSKSVSYPGIAPISQSLSSNRAVEVAGERRRELVRSQTLPRNIGTQAHRSIFEKLDSDFNRPKPFEAKPKLKRSQSFGVSSASSIKQILLEWCRSKTIGYQNIDIQNFSSSWSDGLAFCALVHSFFPTEFDYNDLTPADPKHNFEVAFTTAEQKAGCDRLIEVEDMMVMGRKPDPMCVFTYVQSLYNHLRKFE
ncbi:smoothelin, like [Scleropages formosus]|uniref:Smoothelin like 2 n=1 Tax=Scleropages formosus TaxID=113540 RepID=A0A8C9V4L0_SCLFO|nr:smoothelin-like protein 2 [Scleropages formosus]